MRYILLTEASEIFISHLSLFIYGYYYNFYKWANVSRYWVIVGSDTFQSKWSVASSILHWNLNGATVCRIFFSKISQSNLHLLFYLTFKGIIHLIAFKCLLHALSLTIPFVPWCYLKIASLPSPFIKPVIRRER